MRVEEAARSLETRLERLTNLRSARSVVVWDEATMMPPSGARARGEQLALLGELEHAWLTDGELERALEGLRGSDDPVHQRTVVVLGRELERALRVDRDLVVRLSRARSEAFAAWSSAKANSAFGSFAPALTRLLDLVLEECEAVGPGRHPYDVVLEAHDPGLDTAQVSALFGRLKPGLVRILTALDGGTAPPKVIVPAAIEVQRTINREVAAALGYDFDAGRLDDSVHPFTIGIAAGDVRITTRYDTSDLLWALGGTIHEVGHALYEQGLPREALAGTGLDEAASMGVHESQSRFWENVVGRSPAFSAWLADRLRHHLGPAAPGAEALYGGLNRVDRGAIRVDADEVTYNLHIAVRFELELALMEGRLAVRDIPEAWNEAYRSTLGLVPPDDARGCLQDVHWSYGSFGYFPSYTLGNLYAAAFAATLQARSPGWGDEVRRGEFGTVLRWLRDHVHRSGRLLEPPDLVRRVCGDRDMVEDLLTHLWRRHGALYGVTAT